MENTILLALETISFNKNSTRFAPFKFEILNIGLNDKLIITKLLEAELDTLSILLSHI